MSTPAFHAQYFGYNKSSVESLSYGTLESVGLRMDCAGHLECSMDGRGQWKDGIQLLLH